MWRTLLSVIGLMLAMGAVTTQAQDANHVADAHDWLKLSASNNLDFEGNKPFDLAMTFQLHDMDGKPTEAGSVEVWWKASDSPQRIVVHLEGLNEDGSAPEGASPALVRDSYLVRQLLDAAVHPVPIGPWLPKGLATINGKAVVSDTTAKDDELITKTVMFGKTALDCTFPKVSDRMKAEPTTLCVAPKSMDVVVRQNFGGKEMLLRSRTAKFQETYVALELSIRYLGREAIDGKLTVMKPWSASPTEVKAPSDAADKKTEPKADFVSGAVIAGNRIKFTEPYYPETARMGRLSGTVIFSAIIGVDGRLRRLVPIASTAPMFTVSATDAVKQWLYRPYLLNGKPTEVDTTITVNYAMN